MQALLLRNLRKRKAMGQGVADYNRLPPSDSNKSYDYLMRRARTVFERNRLRWHRDEPSRSIGGGWVNSVGKGKDKGIGKAGAKGKDKPKGAAGN